MWEILLLYKLCHCYIQCDPIEQWVSKMTLGSTSRASFSTDIESSNYCWSDGCDLNWLRLSREVTSPYLVVILSIFVIIYGATYLGWGSEKGVN